MPADGFWAVTVFKAPDAATIMALHKLVDSLPDEALDGLATYIATVRRQRNAATSRKAA